MVYSTPSLQLLIPAIVKNTLFMRGPNTVHSVMYNNYERNLSLDNSPVSGK